MSKAQFVSLSEAVHARSVVASWTDERLAAELLRPTRLTLPGEDLMALITEALARLLKRDAVSRGST